MRPRTSAVVLCSLAMLLGGAVYLNALSNPFVYDDYRTIVDNATIRSMTDARSVVLHDVTRPLVNISYALDAAVWGATPLGFHVTSVLLHLLNVALLFFIALRLAGDRREDDRRLSAAPESIAFVAAGAFAVHPLMTEAVGYVSARSEVLCATIFLAAFMCGRRWMRGGGASWWLLTVTLWAAAVLTREITSVLPLALLAYDRLLLIGNHADDESSEVPRSRRMWRLHLPLIGLSLAAAIVRIAVFARIEHPGDVSLRWTSILDQAIVSWQYVRLFVAPNGQSLYHAFRPVASIWDAWGLFALAAMLAVVAAAVFASRVDRLIRFGIVWFFLLLAPSAVLGLLGHGDAMAEHRVYLASCGLFLVCGATIGSIIARLSLVSGLTRVLAHAVIVIALLSLGARTVIRNFVWGDPIALWREAAVLAPDDPLPHTVLGEELDQSGRYQEAAVEYRTALRLDPNNPHAYLKLGVCLATLRKFDEARAVFEHLRSAAPESPLVSTGLGAVALMAGQATEARALFVKTLERDPHDIMARQWLAVLEEEAANDPAAALRRCVEIHELAPNRSSNDDCIRRNRARLAMLAGSPARH